MLAGYISTAQVIECRQRGCLIELSRNHLARAHSREAPGVAVQALYDTPMFREFAALDTVEGTVLGFRHLLERGRASPRATGNTALAAKGPLFKS